jgi:dTDP-4-dehydrorhamnose reductase
MKILLLGKNGHVGWELNRTLLSLGEIIALDIDDLDLTRTHEIRQTVRTIKPNIIVNAAAYTAVDKAEVEQELAMAINGVAPGIIAIGKTISGNYFFYIFLYYCIRNRLTFYVD